MNTPKMISDAQTKPYLLYLLHLQPPVRTVARTGIGDYFSQYSCVDLLNLLFTEYECLPKASLRDAFVITLLGLSLMYGIARLGRSRAVKVTIEIDAC